MYLILLLALCIGMLTADIKEFFYKDGVKNDLAYLLMKTSVTLFMTQMFTFLIILNRYLRYYEKALKSLTDKFSNDKQVQETSSPSNFNPDFDAELVHIVRGKNNRNSDLEEYSQETKLSKRGRSEENDDPLYLPEAMPEKKRGKSKKKLKLNS